MYLGVCIKIQGNSLHTNPMGQCIENIWLVFDGSDVVAADIETKLQMNWFNCEQIFFADYPTPFNVFEFFPLRTV